LVKLEAGTQEEVDQDVREKIKILGPGYRYILSSSNSITENVKPENLRAMMSALEKYGKYPLE
jgi:uroporphyrinogen decarboxylase